MPEILSLAACQDLPVSEVGERVLELVQLHAQELTIPTTYVVPRTTLQGLLDHNHFEIKLAELFQEFDAHDSDAVEVASRKLQTALLRCMFPGAFVSSFTEIFGAQANRSFFAIRASSLSGAPLPHTLSELNVRGEANVIESILRVLAKLYAPHFLADRYEEWRAGQQLPAAIIIQEMVEASVSGLAVIDPEVEPPAALITASWGVAGDRGVLEQQGDRFTVELGSGKILHQTLGVKKVQYARTLDTLAEVAVPKGKQGKASLSAEMVGEIAVRLRRTAHNQFHPQEIEWAIADKHLYFLSMQEHVENSAGTTPPQAHASTAKLTESSSQKLPIIPFDQSTVISATELLLRDVQQHPSELLQTNRADVLKSAIVTALVHAQRQHPPHQVWYRTQDFRTDQLTQLPHGAAHEKHERNPYLGYRGAIRMISSPTFLHVELDALMESFQITQRTTRFLVPFVRTVAELHLLLTHFHQTPHETAQCAEFWLECGTPENILNVAQYCAKGVSGLVINITQLHSLLHGIDPDSEDLAELYPLDLGLLRKLLTDFTATAAKHHLPVILMLDHYNHELVELALELKVAGVIARPEIVGKLNGQLNQ